MATGNTFLQAVGLGNQARLEEVGSTNLPLGIGGTPSGAARDGGLRNTINKLLGDDITLNTTRSVDLDRSYASAPQAAMGLTVAVRGWWRPPGNPPGTPPGAPSSDASILLRLHRLAAVPPS